jgi:hypothetical protein
MKTSCIPHPPGEPLVIIRTWQVEACGGNHCAAALLNFFEHWHNMKLDNQQQAKSLNDVAEKHGEPRGQEESLMQWHSLEALVDGVLGLYGRNLVQTAVKVLESLHFISIHKNPNPLYKWDKTNFYLFRPEAVIAWLRANRGLDRDYSPKTPVKSDSLFLNDRESENKPLIVEKGTIDATENKLAIPKITTEKKEEPTPTPSTKRKGRVSGEKGSRLPEDWQPTEANLAWAHKKGYHTLVNLDDMTEEFCRYWWSRAKDNTKLDWSMTWQNRVQELAKQEQDRRVRFARPTPSEEPQYFADGGMKGKIL